MKFLKPQDVGKCERFLMLPFDIFESDLPPKAKLLYANEKRTAKMLAQKHTKRGRRGGIIPCHARKAYSRVVRTATQ